MSNAMEDWLPRHRITVEEYHRMGELGLFAPDARVELIEGEIIDMAPIGSGHGTVVDRLSKRLMFAVMDQAIVRTQGTVELSRWNQVQPDISVLKPRSDEYSRANPCGAEALLIVEVSDTSLRYDCSAKLALYARYGVREVWVADVVNRRVHFFREPGDVAYADVSVMAEPGSIAVPFLRGLSVNLNGLFDLEPPVATSE
ncbi:MAG: Uma2 family endonuclease [Gammaproteobacteria bacterium]